MRRETWEETGIEVGQVVYHSSQPWPGNVLGNRFVVFVPFRSFSSYFIHLAFSQ